MAPPELVRGLGELRAVGDARVVDEHVAAPAEELARRRERRFDRARVGHVTGGTGGHTLAELRAQLCGHALHLTRGARDDEDARALPGEGVRDRAADAAPAARDE